MTASLPRHRGCQLLGIAVLLFGIAGAASGCSAGLLTQTAAQVPAVPGANANAGAQGQIALRDLVVSYNGPKGYAKGGSAPLMVRIFNGGLTPVQLSRVQCDDAAAVSLVGAAAPPQTTASASPDAASSTPSPRNGAQQRFTIDIAALSYVLLVPGQGAFLRLDGLTRPVMPGESVTITFTFTEAGTTTSTVTVVVPVDTPEAPLPRPSVPSHGE